METVFIQVRIYRMRKIPSLQSTFSSQLIPLKEKLRKKLMGKMLLLKEKQETLWRQPL